MAARTSLEKAQMPNGVGALMHTRYISVSPEESLAEVRQLMRLARLRHLPVVRDGYLEGLVSYRDLLESLTGGGRLAGRWDPGESLENVEAERAMVRPTHVVTPDRSPAEAASQLWRLGIGCLPVVDETPGGQRLVGLVTETDLLRAAYDPWFRGSSW